MTNEQAPAENARPGHHAKTKGRWPGFPRAAVFVGEVTAAVAFGVLLPGGSGDKAGQEATQAPSPTRAPQAMAALSCRLETAITQDISDKGAKVVIRAHVNPDDERLYLAAKSVGTNAPDSPEPHVTPHPRQVHDGPAPFWATVTLGRTDMGERIAVYALRNEGAQQPSDLCGTFTVTPSTGRTPQIVSSAGVPLSYPG